MSFAVDPGQCLLVLGPSGSGKSTLALAIAGLVPRERPGEWRGRLTIDDLDVTHGVRTDVALRVGLVFQDSSAQIVMERVEDDVAFGLENRGWPPVEMRRRVPETLDAVGLTGLDRAATRVLSGGQQQRLALAGVLAPTPSVLVLDEATANLDPDGAAAFSAHLAETRADQSTTVVLIEQRVELAWPLADALLVLGPDGRPIYHGPRDALPPATAHAIADAGVWLPAHLEPDSSRGHLPQSARTPQAGASTTPVVTVDGLAFAYGGGPNVVRGVDLVIRPGERVALVGPNASGKSTLGRLLVGLLRPAAGTVRLLGAAPHRLSAKQLAGRAAYVFQNPEEQFLADRVADEIAVGLDEGQRAASVRLMDALNMPLSRFGERSPYTLSGGEQRRLSVASALVREPALLVLDEPTYGQDRSGYRELLRVLDERVDAGAAVLAATHDLRFARDFADRVLTMRDGRIVQDRPT